MIILQPIVVKTSVRNTSGKSNGFDVNTILLDASGEEVARKTEKGMMSKDGSTEFPESFVLKKPDTMVSKKSLLIQSSNSGFSEWKNS